MLVLIGTRIAPHIPVWDKSSREDGTLSRSDFRWDRRRGVYICPNGKVLHTTGTVHEGYKTLLSRFQVRMRSLSRSRCSAAPKRRHEKCPAMFMNMLMRTKAFLKSCDWGLRLKITQQHRPNPKTYFFNNIGSFTTFRVRPGTSALHPLATESLRRAE